MNVSFGSKKRPRKFWRVVSSGFSMRLFCFVHAKTLCRYGCIYFLDALVLVCVDVMVMIYV